MTPALRQQILHDPSTGALNTAAHAGHFKTMIDDGLDRVREGLTTVEEVLRVAG